MIDLNRLATPTHLLDPIEIRRIETFIYQAQVAKPVVSTLATLNVRSALLIRIEDQDGAFGWGEIYATMPSFSAPHRANIVHQSLSNLLQGQSFRTPSECWYWLQSKTHTLQLQTAEFGPFSAAIAGLDCAFWDLYSRKQHLPLAECLGGKLHPLPVYASGLNPADGAEVVEQSRENGFRAFKQKIGFGPHIDIPILEKICATLSPEELLMVDINQGWNIEKIREISLLLHPFPLHWIEEPLQVDRSSHEWQFCRELLNKPLAGGENLRDQDFDTHAAWLDVMQPDVGKWGGISANYAVAKKAIDSGKTYCPHWLGSGLGLMASAHLLCALGGDGLLEMDVNDNPLRNLLAHPLPNVVSGKIELNSTSGIGVLPLLELASNMLIHHQETVL